MLLEDFVASARSHIVQKNLLPNGAVHYSYYLKLNDIIAQRKTANTEKQFYQ